MTYEEDELLQYDEYLNDIRQMIIEEAGLKVDNPYQLEFLEIEAIKKSGLLKMKFVVSEDGETPMLIYEGLSFDDWLIMKRRDKKLDELFHLFI